MELSQTIGKKDDYKKSIINLFENECNIYIQLTNDRLKINKCLYIFVLNY